MSALRSITEKQVQYPNAYYSVDVNKPAALLATNIRRQEYELWQTILPDSEDDFALVVAEIRRVTGKGERQVEDAINAHTRIRELPYLRQLQELTFRLDQSRLVAIDAVLSQVDDETLIEEIDRRITLYLIPTNPNQQLPTAGQIRRRMKDLIRLLAPKVDVDAKKEPRPPNLTISHGEDGKSYIDLDAPTVVALEVEKLIRSRAKEKSLNYAEALLDLLRGTSETKIVLNVYRAWDVEDAPAYAFGAGWLDPDTTEGFVNGAHKVRDMDEVADKVSSAYKTPEDVRTYVVGRDGVCRWPGHSLRADNCQMDHTVDFADGGETTGDNLSSLCGGHHNVKTDGRVHPVQVGDGLLVWLFENGTWVLSEPEGPLSKKARNWVQTVGQRIANRRERDLAPLKPEPETGADDLPDF